MNTHRSNSGTITETPEVGDRYIIDRPDWFASGIIIEVEPHVAITGHDGTQVTRAVDPDRFEIRVAWQNSSAEITGPFTTTVRVRRG